MSLRARIGTPSERESLYGTALPTESTGGEYRGRGRFHTRMCTKDI